VVLDDGWGPAGIVDADTGVRSAADADSVGAALLDGLALSRLAETPHACRAAAEGYDWRTQVAPRLLDVYANHG
jgi:hypothetical protein